MRESVQMNFSDTVALTAHIQAVLRVCHTAAQKVEVYRCIVVGIVSDVCNAGDARVATGVIYAIVANLHVACLRAIGAAVEYHVQPGVVEQIGFLPFLSPHERHVAYRI